MIFISWNIDSLNAAVEHKSRRGKMTFNTLSEIARQQPDFFSIQETKLSQKGLTSKQDDILEELFPNYLRFLKSSVPPARKGYAGVLTLTKHKPINFYKPIVIKTTNTINDEGRIIILEYKTFFLLNIYSPNSGAELKRLPLRNIWDSNLKKLVSKLAKKKMVIFSGDLNVAHEEIDLKHPRENRHSADFTDQERQSFTNLLNSGFVDTWRLQHPKQITYTYWSQRSKLAKRNNSGWRVDYFLINKKAKGLISKTGMIDTGQRADHCPIYLETK